MLAANAGDAHPSPSIFGLVNTIAVLSRIDMADDFDPFGGAQKVIEQHQAAMLGVATTIVPVLGLLAETAMLITDEDYRNLVKLIALQDVEFRAPLFASAAARAGLTDAAIERIPTLLGAYGLRYAVNRLRSGVITSRGALAGSLLAESRLGDLERALRQRFTDRTDALKARTAVRSLERLCRTHPELAAAIGPDLARIMHLDRMHTLREYEAYEQWKSGVILRRRLGEALTDLALGQDVAVRVGLEHGATEEQLRNALEGRLSECAYFLNEQWPLASRDIARVMRRSYSLMLADLKPGGGE